MRRQSAQRALAVSCSIFLAFGMLNGAWGATLPDLASNAASGLAATGLVFTALFLGGLASEATAGLLTDRFGQRPVIAGGLALVSAGALGVSTSHALALTLLCAAVAGLGVGAIEVGVQVLVATVFAERSVRALNFLNIFFGAGAVIGPFLAGIIARRWHTTLPVLWIVAALFLAQLLLVITLPLPARPRAAEQRLAPGRAIYRSPALWTLGALLLVYVGVETGIGGWTVSYVMRTNAVAVSTAALVASSFWLALTGGRILAVYLAKHLTSYGLVGLSLCGAALGGLLLVVSLGHFGFTVAAVVLLGFSFGPIFPTALAITTGLFRDHTGQATSVVVALGSVGGSLLPPLQGLLLVRTGARASAVFVLAETLAMLALFVGVRMGRAALAHEELMQVEEVRK